jgi:hypothetical protein
MSNWIPDEDDDKSSNDLPLKEALAWIASRNQSFVHALSGEWDLELHRIAERRGIEMKFASSGTEAWKLLRDAICGGRIRAKGILGLASDYPHGDRVELRADVAGNLELVRGSSLWLEPRNLSANPERWSRIRLNLADLQKVYPATEGIQGVPISRGVKKAYALKLLKTHFPGGPQGRNKTQIVAQIMKLIATERNTNEVLPSEKTVGRAVDEWVKLSR